MTGGKGGARAEAAGHRGGAGDAEKLDTKDELELEWLDTKDELELPRCQDLRRSWSFGAMGQ